MKEVKAYVHANRIADVIAALKASTVWAPAAGESPPNLAIYVVKGFLAPIDNVEAVSSIELGDEIVNECKLELLCADDHVSELVEIIRRVGRTGQTNAGWVCVMAVQQALPIT